MNMKKWVAEAINQAEIIDAVAEKLAEKFESEEQEWPPYGVPIEVLSINGEWVPRIGAGYGYYYSSTGEIISIDTLNEWRYKPVDWERVDAFYNSRIVYSNGNIKWYWDRAKTLEEGQVVSGTTVIAHIDRRPV